MMNLNKFSDAPVTVVGTSSCKHNILTAHLRFRLSTLWTESSYSLMYIRPFLMSSDGEGDFDIQ